MESHSDVVDMALFYGTADEKQLFCKTLVDMLKKKGCVKIQNHRIPTQMIQKLFDLVRRLNQYIIFRCTS
jgi:isopenicillin N synthase-like dioxygenase